MSTIRVTKEFRFEAAHALTGYDGVCKNIHGHSYELSVTLTGNPIHRNDSPKNGMVIDFNDCEREHDDEEDNPDCFCGRVQPAAQRHPVRSFVRKGFAQGAEGGGRDPDRRRCSAHLCGILFVGNILRERKVW